MDQLVMNLARTVVSLLSMLVACSSPDPVGRENKHGFAMGRRATRRVLLALAVITLLGLIGAAGVSNDVDRSASADEFWNYSEIDAGAFCITGIPDGAITRVSRPRSSPLGDTRDIEIVFEDAGPTARIIFLDAPRRLGGPWRSCSKQVPGDVATLFEGSILHGKVVLTVPTAIAGDRARWVQIDQDGLVLNVEPSRFNFKTLYGGTVKPGRELRITTVGMARFDQGQLKDNTDDVLEGTVRFGSRRLTLSDMKVHLSPGANQASITADATTKGAAFDLELSTARVSLYDGELVSRNVTLPPGETAIGGISLALTAGSAARGVLTGHKGVIQFSLQQVALTAPRWEHALPRAVAQPSGPVTADSIKGGIPFSATEAVVVDHVIEDAAFPSGMLTIGGIGEAPAISGTGTAHIALLNSTNVDATLKIATPQMPALDALSGDLRSKSMTLRLQGDRAEPSISGSLLPIHGQIANTHLDDVRKAALSFGPVRVAAEYEIPIRIDAPAASGSWTFTDPSGAIVYLEGALEKLRLKGSLWIGTGDHVPRLDVPAGEFVLGASGSVRVLHPFLFGGAPTDTKIGAGFALGTATGFAYGRGTQSGSLDISASFFEVSEPSLTFETDREPRFRITAPARLQGDASVRFALDSGVVSLASGHVNVGAARAEAIGDAPIDISGIAITGSSLAFDSLAITAKDGHADVDLRGLAIDAHQLTHAEAPHWTADEVLPRFEYISASLDRIDRSVELKEIEIHELSLTAAHGKFVSPDGFDVTGNQFSILAKKLTRSSIEDGEIRIGSGVVALNLARDHQRTTGSTRFDEFRIAANGTKDDLRGEGRLALADLEVTHHFALIPDKCGDDLPLIAQARLGRVELDVAWLAGTLGGRASVQNPRVSVKEGRAGSSCTWRQDFDVSIAKTVQAWQCLSFNIFGCILAGWVDKIINTSVDVTVPFTAILLRLRAGGEADSATVSIAGKEIGLCLSDVSLTPETAFPQVFSVAPDLGAYGGEIGQKLLAPTQLVQQAAWGFAESEFINTILRPLTLLTQATNINACN